jgi:hypothetical protein
MLVYKCDICKKVIKDKENSSVSVGTYFRNKTLCNKCGKPILDFMIKNNLIEKKEKN